MRLRRTGPIAPGVGPGITDMIIVACARYIGPLSTLNSPSGAQQAVGSVGLDESVSALSAQSPDNCALQRIHYRFLDPTRHHYVKATVAVLRHLNGSLSLLHGPRWLGGHDREGRLIGPNKQQIAA